jgi:hypothetical protein
MLEKNQNQDEAEIKSKKQLRNAVIVFAIIEFIVIIAVLYYKS